MRAILLAMSIALALALAVAPERPGLPAPPDLAALEPVEVTAVIDADTIRIEGDVIRLVGIDAPEEIARHGRESTIWMHNLLDGEAVWLVTKEDEERDRYNRRLCYVYRAPDGLFVNLEAVRQGYARDYRRFPHRFSPEFRAWEARARAHNKGLWRRRRDDE